MIRLLDADTIDKIAAGEVIERPSSVVKELVENSIDSGATAVTVEIKEGGLSYIRITDNGCGISSDEVPKAFLRHATSKLITADDLIRISSLGFRGEALSSIAAVAQVEMLTKTKDDILGIRYMINGGCEADNESIGCPDGTTIIVRNLFYNTPARKKYMKTASTEMSYIYELICQISMSHPEISFKFIANGTNKLFTSGNGKLKDIIYHIYGRDITSNLMSVDASNDFLHIHGFIAKPCVSRGNRGFENYYVNNRYIKSKIITKAIEDSFRTFVMIHKFPFSSLYFDISPELIDVNIHPAKMELKFVNEQEIYDFTYNAIRETLLYKELIPETTPDRTKPEPTYAQRNTGKKPEPFEMGRKMSESVTKNVKDNIMFTDNEVKAIPEKEILLEEAQLTKMQRTISENVLAEDTDSYNTGIQQTLFTEEFLTEKARVKHRIIGQLFNTYWLIEYENKLFIMDQHAAHEKVKFEELMENYKSKKIVSQYLMPPAVISLNPSEMDFLNSNMEMFEALGYQLEAFGDNEYKLNAVPANLFGLDGRELFIDFIGELITDAKKTTMDIFISKLSTMACKAAIKGNTSISFEEADALITQLMTLENPYTCPHGRPTIISMTESDIEKKFKRIV